MARPEQNDERVERRQQHVDPVVESRTVDVPRRWDLQTRDGIWQRALKRSRRLLLFDFFACPDPHVPAQRPVGGFDEPEGRRVRGELRVVSGKKCACSLVVEHNRDGIPLAVGYPTALRQDRTSCGKRAHAKMRCARARKDRTRVHEKHAKRYLERLAAVGASVGRHRVDQLALVV
eukprot:945420-Rhodomonas_salina.1